MPPDVLHKAAKMHSFRVITTCAILMSIIHIHKATCCNQSWSSETFFILTRIQKDIITNVHTSSCRVLVILVRF